MSMGALPMPSQPSRRGSGHPTLRALPGGVSSAQASVCPDTTLVERVRGGDREAFGILVQRHHRVLAGLIRQRLGPAEPVEDLLQDAFTKALANIDRFAGRSSFVTWAGSIALNLATDWQRKQARRRLAPPADVEQDVLPDRSRRAPAERMAADEDVLRARQAIEQLPEAQRMAVTLRVIEDLPYTEVADRLAVPVPTVRTWVSRGLRRLRQILEQNDEVHDGK